MIINILFLLWSSFLNKVDRMWQNKLYWTIIWDFTNYNFFNLTRFLFCFIKAEPTVKILHNFIDFFIKVFFNFLCRRFLACRIGCVWWIRWIFLGFKLILVYKIIWRSLKSFTEYERKLNRLRESIWLININCKQI